MGVQEFNESADAYYYVNGWAVCKKAEPKSDGEYDSKAKCRKYDVNGNKWEKWEYRYKNISGVIGDVKFVDTDFWTNCVVHLYDENSQFALTLWTNGKYFTAFARKLKNIDLNEPVTISPFDFEGDDKKKHTGLSITQDWEKIADYYYDGKKNTNWMPEPDIKDKKDKDEWKMYFLQVKKFLIEEVKGVEFLGVIAPEKKKDDGDEISVSDIPF